MERTKDSAVAGKAADGKAVVEEMPQSVQIASRGIHTDSDAAEYLSAVIGDVMTQTVPVRTVNAGINAMGKLLKLVEMRQKYGDPEKSRSLVLVGRTVGHDEKAERRKMLLRELNELDASGEMVKETVGAAR